MEGGRLEAQTVGLELATQERVERSAGFESSTVLVQKVAEPTVDWDVLPADIASELYPA